MTSLLTAYVATRLVHLSSVDVVIVVFYFALVLSIGWYLRSRANTGEDVFRGGCGRGTRGCGGVPLPIRHSGDPLVLDRRHPGDAVPGAGHDAVLLHFQDPLRARIFETAFRRACHGPVRGFVCVHY